MSSNVGLTTPRGSGTSGYVQRNLSALKPRNNSAPYPPRDSRNPLPQHRALRQPDKSILEHERKRAIEVKCLELQDELEEAGELGEEEIEAKVAELRVTLAKADAADGDAGGRKGKGLKSHQVHELAAAKMGMFSVLLCGMES